MNQTKRRVLTLAVTALVLGGGGTYGWMKARRSGVAVAQSEHGEVAEHGSHTAGHAVEGHSLGDGHAERIPAAHGEAHGKTSTHSAATTPPVPSMGARFWAAIVDAADQIQVKAKNLEELDRENERLRVENAHLRMEMEANHFTQGTEDSNQKTAELKESLRKETGSAVGRDLASIEYEVPHQLPPSQLYALAVSYFKAHEDEKAAVILNFLTELENTDIFRTPRNYLLTGISFYRIDQLSKAEAFFDRVLKSEPSEANLQTHAHARLWKALVAQRLGKHAKVQFWLTELVDHHPRSQEASWVNLPIRKPAGGGHAGPKPVH